MLDELLSLCGVRKGHFRLESGHHGDLWLDLDHLFLAAGSVRRFSLTLAARLSRHGVDAVCGPMMGGALIAQTVAAELGAEFFYTQRFLPVQGGAVRAPEYRVPTSLRPLLFGRSVAVVDDVINAGSATRGTMAGLGALGAHVAVVGALLVLGTSMPELLLQQSIPLESIGHPSSNLWLPAECPLCAAGVPLEDLIPG